MYQELLNFNSSIQFGAVLKLNAQTRTPYVRTLEGTFTLPQREVLSCLCDVSVVNTCTSLSYGEQLFIMETLYYEYIYVVLSYIRHADVYKFSKDYVVMTANK